MIKKKTIKCSVCKEENPSGINFCKNCRYPINIKKIDELTKKDLSVCLLSFLEVIRKERKSLFKDKELEQVYDELLALNWLRPESALFRFTEAEILLGFKDKYLKYPILDLGCGDGLFTSILFGARINKAYDYYESVDFKQKDVYNSYTKLAADFLIRKPSPIGFGLDIKENAVRRANGLKTYDKVKVGDVRKLPFEDGSVNSVFSNIIDEIKTKDLSAVFKEVNRVLKTDGYFVFTNSTKRFREFLFYYNKAQKFKKQGKMTEYSLFSELNRGRSAWYPRSLSLWRKLFKETSFELVKCIEYRNSNMIKLWDTGFRPFFYYLMTLRSILIKNDFYLSLKSIFLEMLREYLFKYTKGQISEKGAFAMIVAKKIKK